MNGVVKLDEIVTSMDRDLVLYIQVAEPHKASLVAEVCFLFVCFSYPIYLFFKFLCANFRNLKTVLH